MTTRRIAKLSSAIHEQISTSILFELKDPRVKNVTVLGVEVSPDAQSAKVSISVLGDERDEALCLKGLNSARGFLQAKVAARIQTRYTPILTFKIDRGVKRSIEISQLLQQEAADLNLSSDSPSETAGSGDLPADTGDSPHEEETVADG